MSTRMSSSTSDSPSAGSACPAGSRTDAGYGSRIITSSIESSSHAGQAGSVAVLPRTSEALSHAWGEASIASFLASTQYRQVARSAVSRSWPVYRATRASSAVWSSSRSMALLRVLLQTVSPPDVSATAATARSRAELRTMKIA